jgi:hypothetical protein
MLTFKQHIREYAATLHDDAFVLPPGDFIDALALLNAQVTDSQRGSGTFEIPNYPGRTQGISICYAFRHILYSYASERLTPSVPTRCR